MNDSKATTPAGYILAAELFNKVLRHYMTRQLFYGSVVPIFQKAGLAYQGEGSRYVYIDANLDDWRTYAEYRTAKVNSHEWIKRRPWSLEDLQLAVEAQQQPEPVPA